MLDDKWTVSSQIDCMNNLTWAVFGVSKLRCCADVGRSRGESNVGAEIASGHI